MKLLKATSLSIQRSARKSKDGIPNREFFLCMLLIAGYKKNKSLLDNIQNNF